MYRRMGLLLVPSSVRKILLMSVYTCYFVVVAVVVGAVSIGACIAIASRLALGVPVVGPWPVLPVAVSVCVAFTLDLKMWFLVCFCGRVRWPSGGRSSLRLRLGGFVSVCCLQCCVSPLSGPTVK
jgi:hypothetical protein